MKATSHKRVTLFLCLILLLALAGGAPGGLLAMLVARHKIRTTAFAAGLPMMLVLQVVVVAYLLQLGLA